MHGTYANPASSLSYHTVVLPLPPLRSHCCKLQEAHNTYTSIWYTWDGMYTRVPHLPETGSICSRGETTKQPLSGCPGFWRRGVATGRKGWRAIAVSTGKKMQLEVCWLYRYFCKISYTNRDTHIRAIIRKSAVIHTRSIISYVCIIRAREARWEL